MKRRGVLKVFLENVIRDAVTEHAKRKTAMDVYNNARPPVAKVVKETLEALQWDVLPHPLYSPDIAPSDYHMFRSMTHGLAEQHFTSYEEAKNWVNVWIASKDEEFFRHGIRRLPERWEKVVAKDGQYFE
ncbi:hypothetical protein LAZ67_23001994 [Cordylochernes scorpioides]|uniref:Mariner Mos1 transposase n=1 Tax=Cordylochernes scorpioides TaxID=51811 RepID=A0ABY6LS26_9ARAC|nr:hypothetical protein LAZ67_23001994 [Cordylochernes scorpioides]